MNLPNKITMIRVILIPVYVILMVMSMNVANVTGESGANTDQLIAGDGVKTLQVEVVAHQQKMAALRKIK